MHPKLDWRAGLLALCIGNPLAQGFPALPAVAGNPYGLSLETDPSSAREARDAFMATGQSGRLEGEKKIGLHYRVFHPEGGAPGKRAVVIASGRTESVLGYAELIHDLSRQGYTVYIHDHRGQGQSDRLVADDPDKGHVDAFDHYVKDLKTLVNEVVRPAQHDAVLLLAHSMGGAIASLYLQRYPGDFPAAALISPMHEPLLPLLGTDATDLVCTAFQGLKKVLPPTDYAPGQGRYNPPSFAKNDYTHSAVRYAGKLSAYQEGHIGGPTNRWIQEACAASEKARADAGKISVPVLLLQAGEDTAVRNEAQLEFCKKVNAGNSGGRCEGLVVEKAYHSLFIEADTFRVPAMSRVLEFFKAVP